MAVDPASLVRPRRRITGMSAVLLPFAGGAIDWTAFEAHVVRTADAGLVPAVNMDTGYVNLLDAPQRREVLERTGSLLAGAPFVAGAFVADRPGDAVAVDAYRSAADEIQRTGGIPVVFPSHGLATVTGSALVSTLAEIGRDLDRFIGFELSPVFNVAGRIWDVETYREVLGIPACIGAKHSSLRREPEWERLQLRNAVRPDFLVLTGNDLAIDMVMYGSDYLLGLSTFAPDLFARRDACWAVGDPAFHELNDGLQHLGNIAFRDPVPAYRHDAAMFLRMRGWTASDETPPDVPRRPAWEGQLLAEVGQRLGVL